MESACVKPDFLEALETPWCGDDLDQMENFPFFNNTATIDFPFIATNVPPAVNPPEANDYIDVKSLVIPNCFRPPQMDGSKSVAAEAERKADVEFVREYKQRRSKTKSTTKEDRPPPRRNPKRQARVHAKQADRPELDKETTVRRSTRTAATTATAAETTHRDWPVDGMHEKPNFNPVTGRLEKLPGVAKRARRFRRLRTDDDDEEQQQQQQQREAHEFAALAHGNLHYALLYVDNVKKRNAMMMTTTQTHATGARPANVAHARDLLEDACTMYCVAHDVAEESLATYLDAVGARADLAAYLRGVLDARQ